MNEFTASLGLEIGGFNAKLAEASNRAYREADRMKKQTRGMGASAAKGFMDSGVGKLAAGIVTVNSLVRAGEAMKSYLTHADDLADFSSRLNTNAESLQRVAFASERLASVPLENVVTMMSKMETKLADVKNVDAPAALRRLGLEVESFMALPVDEKLVALSEGFKQARLEGHGAADIAKLFEEEGVKLVPMLEAGGEKLREMFGEAPVLMDATVQRMAELNDQLDGFLDRVKGFGGEAVASVVGLGDFAYEYVKGLTDGPIDAFYEAMDAMAEAQIQADKVSLDRERNRKETAAGIADTREAAKEEAERKKREDAEKKAAEAKEAALERINAARQRMAREDIAELPEVEQLGELQKLLDEVFETMQQTGGAFFDSSLDGLEGLVQRRIDLGDLTGAEEALKLLEQARELTEEMDEVASSMKEAGVSEAQALQDEVDRLRSQAKDGAFQLLDPVSQAEELRKELSDSLGIDIKSAADAERGLAQLEDEVEAARADGDLEREKTALEKLTEAQEQVQQLAGYSGTGGQGASQIGSVAGAVNQIFGRSGNELILSESRTQTRALQGLGQTLKEIRDRLPEEYEESTFSLPAI